jgi:hypothetical protein
VVRPQSGSHSVAYANRPAFPGLPPRLGADREPRSTRTRLTALPNLGRERRSPAPQRRRSPAARRSRRARLRAPQPANPRPETAQALCEAPRSTSRSRWSATRRPEPWPCAVCAQRDRTTSTCCSLIGSRWPGHMPIASSASRAERLRLPARGNSSNYHAYSRVRSKRRRTSSLKR